MTQTSQTRAGVLVAGLVSIGVLCTFGLVASQADSSSTDEPPSALALTYIDDLENFETLMVSAKTSLRRGRGNHMGVLWVDSDGRVVWDGTNDWRYSLLDGETIQMDAQGGDPPYTPTDIQMAIPFIQETFDALRNGEITWRKGDPYDYGHTLQPLQWDYMAEAVLPMTWAAGTHVYLTFTPDQLNTLLIYLPDGSMEVFHIKEFEVDGDFEDWVMQAEAPEFEVPGTDFVP